jgi:hypothetical protein
MGRFKIEIQFPTGIEIDAVLAETSKKYGLRPATPQILDEIENEVTWRLRRMVNAKVITVNE